MTRPKAVIRAQALYRLAKDKAATVAEAELAREHLDRLIERFELLPHEVVPGLAPPPPPRPMYPPGGFVIVVNGQPIFVRPGGILASFNGTATTATTGNIFFG